MSDNKDVEKFNTAAFDFGTKPEDYPLTDDQKKLSIYAMAVNATIIQLITEGVFPHNQQIHFMGHLQDFMQRLYDGESIKMDGTAQTLQINSKAGTLFFEAMSIAFKHGSEAFAKIKELGRQYVEQLEAQAADGPPDKPNPSKPTLH